MAAALLLGSLATWPQDLVTDDYLTMLRWVVSASAGLAAYRGYSWRHWWAAAGFSIVAMLFNPIAPVDRDWAVWKPLDVGAALLFLLAVWFVRPRSDLARTG